MASSRTEQISQAVEEGTPTQIDMLGHRVKDMVRTMDKLQQLGVETSDLPLPKIVVVGDQSAGKSSLVEGISGIKVPRSSGTCTRCPLQITLTDSFDKPWYCRITLQKKYSLYSTTQSDSLYGKWGLNDSLDEIFFAETYEIVNLEEALKRAQLATLNPGASYQKYLNTVDVNSLEAAVDFSPNAVRLDIISPGSPNLSFFDLPGIINQTENEADDWLVALVRNLVTEYVNQESSLILLACSMENDLQNSSASALIARCPGAKERTVAVLTKPDRTPNGSPTSIIRKILENKSYQVGHGYYVTKAPSQLDLDGGITQEQAHAAEEGFFRGHPWSTEFQMYQARFGTAHLREALSQKLTDQIIIALPSIATKVTLRLQAVEAELAGYPDPPANALGRVHEALGNFSRAVERHMEGMHPFNELRNDVKSCEKKFEEGLRKQLPKLLTATPAAFLLKDPVTISLLSDDEDDVRSERRSSTPAGDATSARKRKRERDMAALNKTPVKSQKTDMLKTPTSQRQAATQQKPLERGLLQIRSTLEELSLSDIPNETDPRAVDHLRSQSISGWEKAMETFLNQVFDILLEALEDSLEKACEQWLATDFYREVRQMLQAFLSTIMDEQRAFARRAFRLEKFKPITMDDKGIKLQKAEHLRKLQDARYLKRAMEQLQRGLSAEEKEWKEAEHKRKAQTDTKLRAELGADPFAREVEVMAGARGYYEVALLRFLDHVVQGVQAEAFAKCRTELPAQLHAGLMLDDADGEFTRFLRPTLPHY